MSARTTTTLPPTALTARERKILDTLCTGATNQEIAEELIISVRTVNTHFTNISDKLGINGDRRLMAYWFNNRPQS